ncbi:MAG: hypothetical protein PHC30_10255 [Lentisphaeria bacterium]|nr:hypothetical protein [Lentisphaeria bacterium]
MPRPSTSSTPADITPQSPVLQPVAKAAFLLRLGTFSVFLHTFAALLPLLIKTAGARIFHENGIIEWVQFALLGASAAIFFLGAGKRPRFRQLFLLLGTITLFAMGRELDSLLDQAIPILGWKTTFLAFPLLAAALHRHWRDLARQLTAYSRTTAFMVLWTACVLAVPMAQCIGHGEFLALLMEDSYNRIFKRTLEESLEMLGYFTLLYGSVETWLQLRTTPSARAGAK